MGLVKIVKSNRILSTVAYFARDRRCKRSLGKYSKLSIDNKKVFLYRAGGGYADNPKAVAEYLHKHYPDIKLVWACPSFHFDSLPSFIKPVVPESEEYFKELATAGAWVCSTVLPNGIVKRPGQLYIQTWHGDKFLKKIANDSAADIDRYKWRKAASKFCEPKICDYFVTGCEWFIPIAASAFGYRGKFIKEGMPRNDCLVNLDEKVCADIKASLNIDPSVKILIYAPTYRDYEKSIGIVHSDIDLTAIVDALEKKYDCKWICLMRAHGGRQIKLGDGSIEDERFRDVTAYPDMADLLMISDMLISDYSSCGADFAITGKMVLMYQDDIETYTAKGRTLYFSREESPYFTASNMDEALEIINRVTDEEIKANSRGILDFYKSFETGHACKAVVDTIIDSLNKIKN